VSESRPSKSVAPWRQKLWEVIFESDTPAGKLFDIVLLITIVLSVLVVLLESLPNLDPETARLLFSLEIFFTVLFSIEYVFRLISVRRPLRYALSFYGIVDLLAIVPTYISLFVPGAQYFLVVRILRLLRVFRILRLGAYLDQAEMLGRAMYASRIKIGIFLFTVLTIIVIVGAMIYVIEGPENGFTSIPLSIYWAVVTMTTVGYGDLVPETWLGKLLATVLMLVGYSIIAVPTGIVSVEIARQDSPAGQACPGCGLTTHDPDARFCKRCGAGLAEGTTPGG
jgi:voltage-gated potassium channel